MHTIARLIGASLSLAPALAIAQTYSITDLQPGSGFDDAFAYGLSQNGRITGAGTVTATGELHAFTYYNGALQDLGMLGYPYGAGGLAINNTGQIAATGYGPGFRALIYNNGAVHALGGIDGPGNSEGFSINNLGHIVGRAQNGDGGWQGFTYFGTGTFTALGVDTARGINDSDAVVGSVGYYWSYGGYVHGVEHAFVMTGGAITDIGNLGGGLRTNTEAYDINNAGQVTGYSTMADGTMHAFLYSYSDGVMSDLGTISPYNTRGISINSSGQVLGTIETYVGGPVGAFLYTNGAPHDLADLLDASGAGWSDFTPTRINDSGWIVGYGTINGASHGFLARPSRTCQADFNGDGDVGTDADIEAFFECLAGNCCATCGSADFNGDGDVGTDADIESFFSVLAGGPC
jgi:probable HAF family extracellular repeat protein